MFRRLVHLATGLALVAGASACDELPRPQASKRVAAPGAEPAATPAPVRPAAPAGPNTPIPAGELPDRVEQFAPAVLTADITGLPAGEQQALRKLIEAARQLDPLFDRQAYAGNPALQKTLRADKSREGLARARYFSIMRGPWDRQDHHRPFATDKPHPKGAGFYPEDLSAADFEAWVATHPEDAEALRSLYTVVSRAGDQLVATPYSQVYAKWLEPAAAALEEAAGLTANKSLKKFLRSRAQAFRSDDYYVSDKDWMDLDSQVEITIGPYETYEDKLLGLKAAFEAFVTVSDAKASADLMRFKAKLPAMEQHLPIPDAIKTVRGSESPIRVVDLVYSSGDARKSVQTIAFNLPNDERVRKEKGAKKVLLRNLIQTKFEKIMRPIGERVLDPSQVSQLSSDAFFQEVLFHELSHSLGPAFTTKDGEKVEVRVALGASYSPLEEAKADVMGAYNVLYMIEQGEFPKEMREQLLVSYFAGLFRSVRFGVAEAHGKGAALQINYFLRNGGAKFDPELSRFHVALEEGAGLEAAITKLVRELCVLQSKGDAGRAKSFLGEHGLMSPPMERVLTGLDGIPVDIRPIYPLAGEAAAQ